MLKKNIELLNEVFKDVELTREEEHSLLWLANYETSTIQNIISAIKKIRGETDVLCNSRNGNKKIK